MFYIKLQVIDISDNMNTLYFNKKLFIILSFYNLLTILNNFDIIYTYYNKQWFQSFPDFPDHPDL